MGLGRGVADKESTAKKYPNYHESWEWKAFCDNQRSEIKKKTEEIKVGKWSICKNKYTYLYRVPPTLLEGQKNIRHR